jgi:hypothetical protein
MYGGDIIEVTYNNSEVGSGTFRPKAGEGNTYDVGGFRNDASAITGGGESIITKNRKPGFFQVLLSNDMNNQKDVEKLADLAKSTQPTTWTFQVANNKIYRGTGVVDGDIVADIDKATVPLKVTGPQFKQI